MALPIDFTAGAAGHVEAHEATNIELNRVAGIADGLADSLAETIRDILGATLVAGANVTITVGDAGDTVTIAATGGSGGGGGDIDASQIVSGTVPVARLGASGTRDATTYLRGDDTWAVPAGGGGGWNFRPHLPNRWYHSDLAWDETDPGHNPAPGGFGYFTPYLVTGSEAYQEIASVVASEGVGGSGTVMRLGVFAAGSNGYPAGAPLIDSGAIDASIAGDKLIAVTPTTLTPGAYWLAVAHNATSLMLRGTGSSRVHSTSFSGGGTDPTWSAEANCIKVPMDVTTGWPAVPTTGWSALTYDLPLVWLKRAAS